MFRLDALWRKAPPASIVRVGDFGGGTSGFYDFGITTRSKRTETTAGTTTTGMESLQSLRSFTSFGQRRRMTEGFLPKHGGYRRLQSYRKAEIIFDATVRFCDRFIERGSRTRDQMIQAARSGKQNIVEGSMASATSKEMELKLTNVARASLEELLEDYRDFLRLRGVEEWSGEHAYAQRMRELNRIPDATYETFRRGLEHRDPAIVANIVIGLIRVASYLLDRQIRRLERDFLADGGLRERMTRARLRSREQGPK